MSNNILNYVSGSTCSFDHHKQTNSACLCSRKCDYENNMPASKSVGCDFDRLQQDRQSTEIRKNFSEKASGPGCSICNCRQQHEEQPQSPRSTCSCSASKKPNPYFHLNANRDQNIEGCCCGSTSKLRERTKSFGR